MSHLPVLFEDNHLLVVNKPAGLPTMGVSEGEASAWRIAIAYIKRKYQKPGNVFLGVVSRLDTVTSGVLIFARTSKAAERLSEQIRAHQVKKSYWAVPESTLPKASGELFDWVYKDDLAHRMRIGTEQSPTAQQAHLRYRQVAQLREAPLYEIELITGRKHQIRLQFSSRQAPLWGDVKYGGKQSFPAGIALHARSLSIKHPTRDEHLTWMAPLPASWKSLDAPHTIWPVSNPFAF